MNGCYLFAEQSIFDHAVHGRMDLCVGYDRNGYKLTVHITELKYMGLDPGQSFESLLQDAINQACLKPHVQCFLTYDLTQKSYKWR